MERILSMIGLAKKAGYAEIGEEPVGSAARAKHARVIFVACDAAASSVRRAYSFAQSGSCLCLTIGATKDELGRALGRTSCAMAAVTDIGFAEAIVQKLAAMDPALYEAAAQQLHIKARRAAERKAEMLRHKKNIQQGKKPRKTAQPALPPVAEPPARAGRRPSAPPHRSKPGSRRPAPPRSSADRFAGSRPVKKGKGSTKKK